MKKIGILGGTFNPIHKGHINLAKAAKKAFKLEKIVFVPTGIPPHKGLSDLAPKEKRYSMVKLAVKGVRNFEVSRIELDRPGYSYAIDTFDMLRKRYGFGVKLYYIMGLDSINEILTWKKPIELLKICDFIVATRPKSRLRVMKRVLKFPPIKQYLDHVHLIELKMDISSSGIREQIREKKMPLKLLDKDVADYIIRNRMYRKKK